MRALPAFTILVTGLVMFARTGGFEAGTRYPAALLCVGVLAVMLYVGVSPPGGARRLTLVVLAAYLVLTFLSLLWADVDDVASQGANLTLLYATVFLCLVLSRPSTAVASALTLAYGVGVATIGLAIVASAAFGVADPNEDVLFGGRLSSPIGYPNATAAVFALALWPTIGLALQPGVHRLVRASALGTAGALAALNLLCQSRGSIFTLPMVLVLFVILARRRLIAITVAAAVGLATAAMAPVLLDVFRADGPAAQRHALAVSFVAILIGTAALSALGLLLPRLDRLPTFSREATRKLRVGLAATAVAGVAVVLLFASPGSHLSAAWDSFKNGGVPSGSSRFVGLGSNRYDFWRVGLAEFEAHPVLGIGVDNFAVPYLIHRRSDEQPLYPHSLWVRVVSQTGIVGALLLTAFFLLAGWSALRPRADLPGSLVGGLLTGVGAWLLHAQVDWLWEMPALGFGAFFLLGLAVGVESEPPAEAGAPLSRRVRAAGAGAAALAVALAAVSLAVPWLASRYRDTALSAWPDHPAKAIAAARRSAQIDRVSDDGLVLAGTMHSRLRAYEAMRDDFAAALRRNPTNWFSELELALAYGALGNTDQANAHARRASALNPRDPIIAAVVAKLEKGRPVDPAIVDRAIAEGDPT